MAAIDVQGLAVAFGPVQAVADVSFAVASGEIVALLGPNGAGKTTTVETVEGHRRPDAGTVRVLDLDPVREARALRPRIGVMPQSGGVHPGLRPLEALRLHASYYPRPVDPADLLDRVGLTHRRSSTWRRLSGGEQQRLSLALALVGRPEVAFLDEPTAGVDVEGRRAVRDLVTGLRTDGVTVLLTTHDLEEAERVADRIVIVDRGRVVADGTPAELLTQGPQAGAFTFTAAPGIDTSALSASVGAPVEETAPGRYRVAGTPAPPTVAALTAWLAEHDLVLGDLQAGRRRLEDVFLRLTGDGGDGSAG